MAREWRVSYNPALIKALQGLDLATRKRVLGFMRAIERGPLGPASNIQAVPMFMTGTMQAEFGEFTIRYSVEPEENGGGQITFIRLFDTWE
jgi:hypothetical protein